MVDVPRDDGRQVDDVHDIEDKLVELGIPRELGRRVARHGEQPRDVLQREDDDAHRLDRRKGGGGRGLDLRVEVLDLELGHGLEDEADDGDGLEGGSGGVSAAEESGDGRGGAEKRGWQEERSMAEHCEEEEEDE